MNKLLFTEWHSLILIYVCNLTKMEKTITENLVRRDFRYFKSKACCCFKLLYFMWQSQNFFFTKEKSWYNIIEGNRSLTLRRPPQTPKKAKFWGRFAQRLKCICYKEIVDFTMWITTIWTPFEQEKSGGLRKPHFKVLYYKELQHPLSKWFDLI